VQAAPPVTGPAPVMAERGLFSGVFGRGDVDTGDQAWLAAMLDTEAALARALERANLDSAPGLPLAERVAGLLAPAVGAVAANDLIAQASAPAAAGESTLRESLLGVPDVRRRLDQAGITTTQLDAALDPASYFGAAGEFTDAALAPHHAAALARPRDG
jgi:hypothetical protein